MQALAIAHRYKMQSFALHPHEVPACSPWESVPCGLALGTLAAMTVMVELGADMLKRCSVTVPQIQGTVVLYHPSMSAPISQP